MSGPVVVLGALLYLCALFGVAHWGDTRGRSLLNGRFRSTIYALALGIYCTSWTFYGSVGSAMRSGFDFLAIYLGPILVVGFGWRVVRRVVLVARAQNITSVADFLGARFGKSERVARLTAIVALVGAVPYVALQLKAISVSLATMLGAAGGAGGIDPVFGDLALLVAVVLAGFSIAFGTRHIDATEHQDGLVLAIAAESVVKLGAFLVGGLFVVFGLFDGPADLAAAFAARNEGSTGGGGSTASGGSILAAFGAKTSELGDVAVVTLLSAFAILLLPRQFHVTVVENRDPEDVRRASWMFPLYLVLINLFVVPVAAAGILKPGAFGPDMTLLGLPLEAGAGFVAMTVFIGGLSAATAMVIVASVAVAIMVSNDLVMPLVVRERSRGKGQAGRGQGRATASRTGPSDAAGAQGADAESAEDGPDGDLGWLVLVVRRLAIAGVILLGYGYFRLAGDVALASIGLLSFAAIAQLGPSFVAALAWPRATAGGAFAGIGVGFAAWAVLLFLPSLAELGPLGSAGAAGGFVGGVLASLALNVAALVGVSLLRAPTALELAQARAYGATGFQDARLARLAAGASAGAGGGLSPFARGSWPAGLTGGGWAAGLGGRSDLTVADLRGTVARYLGADRTRRAFAEFEAARFGTVGVAAAEPAARPADLRDLRFAEHLLASAIGAASSRLAFSLLVRRGNVSTTDALKLLDDASAVLSQNRDTLQHALDHASQGVTVFDDRRRLVAWNSAFVALYDLPPDLLRPGITSEEIVRFNAARGSYGDGDVEARIAERVEAIARPGPPERLTLHPAARTIELRANALPDGGVVTTYTDVTAAVAAEQALERANETLERRVAERTDELTRANAALARARDEARDANRSKTRFLAAAGHDIAQPLNAARLYVGALLERERAGEGGKAQGSEPTGDAPALRGAGAPGRAPLDAAALAERIDASLEAVEEILSALLDISRLESGRMPTEIASFPLDDLFRQLAIEFGPLAASKGLSLRFVRTSAVARSDRRLLARLVRNLVSNAVKYTREGGVVVGCRRRRGRLVVGVYDTGVGIAPEHRREIFGEFQRLGEGAAQARGLGLGLSIVERIGRTLKHPIGLQSTPGRGSVFTVELPAAPLLPVMAERARVDATGSPLEARNAAGAPTPAETETPASTPFPGPGIGSYERDGAEGALAARADPLSGAVIVAIDNEPAILEAMTTLLGRWGCRAVVAADLDEALARLDAAGLVPDAAVADYRLDVGDGLEAIVALRARYGAELPALLVTADRTPALDADAALLGVRVLPKPLKPAALRAVLSRLRTAPLAAE